MQFRKFSLYLCGEAMRRFLATILACLYLTTTTGATVHLHYCMGRVVDQSLWHSEKEQCGLCGMEKSEQTDSGCCRDEHKQVKVESDHFKSAIAFQVLQFAMVTSPVSSLETEAFDFSSKAEKTPVFLAPDRSCSIAIYKRNSVFRI